MRLMAYLVVSTDPEIEFFPREYQTEEALDEGLRVLARYFAAEGFRCPEIAVWSDGRDGAVTLIARGENPVKAKETALAGHLAIRLDGPKRSAEVRRLLRRTNVTRRPITAGLNHECSAMPDTPQRRRDSSKNAARAE